MSDLFRNRRTYLQELSVLGKDAPALARKIVGAVAQREQSIGRRLSGDERFEMASRMARRELGDPSPPTTLEAYKLDDEFGIGVHRAHQRAYEGTGREVTPEDTIAYLTEAKDVLSPEDFRSNIVSPLVADVPFDTKDAAQKFRTDGARGYQDFLTHADANPKIAAATSLLPQTSDARRVIEKVIEGIVGERRLGDGGPLTRTEEARILRAADRLRPGIVFDLEQARVLDGSDVDAIMEANATEMRKANAPAAAAAALDTIPLEDFPAVFDAAAKYDRIERGEEESPLEQATATPDYVWEHPESKEAREWMLADIERMDREAAERAPKADPKGKYADLF